MSKNRSTVINALEQQLALPLNEVLVEVCPTAEAESRYILKSMQRGQSMYQRHTSEGTFEARRRPGKKGRENLWDIIFRPNR